MPKAPAPQAAQAATAQPTEDLQPELQPTATIKARVLSDCTYGQWGDVVDIDPVLAKGCAFLDTDPAAVAYAMTLPQNQPKASPEADEASAQ